MEIGEAQCSFGKDGRCADQMFVVRRWRKKKLTFMDLDRMDGEVLWQRPDTYGIWVNVLGDMNSFYEQTSACVRVAENLSSCL